MVVIIFTIDVKIRNREATVNLTEEVKIRCDRRICCQRERPFMAILIQNCSVPYSSNTGNT